jgi:hypothetical protein
MAVPRKTGKEFPKQDVQSTWESAFQTYMNLHAGSTWQAERTPKNNVKSSFSLLRCPIERNGRIVKAGQ